MTLQLSQVRAWLGLHAQGASGTARGCSIDSRSVKAGELFFAIRGPSNDGHDYVPEALAKGAVAAVVQPDYRGDGPLLQVEDTSLALRRLGAEARREWGGTVVGVTGSSGKTTTKDIIAALLQGILPVAKSQGNLNNEYGLPLSLLRIPDSVRTAVVEIGINRVGEMRPLAEIAAPDVSVVTNVGTAHVGNFASVEEIAAEKGRLVEALAPAGTAVLNADDDRVAAFRGRHSGTVVTYGIERSADLQAQDVELLGADGARFLLNGHPMRSPLAGRHNVYNVLAAAGAAAALGVAPERLGEPLRGLEPSAMRGRVRQIAGITFIDDCYNASPPAMEAMLEVLRGTPASRRIAVLGEMRELGSRSRELHRRVGAAVGRAGVDHLVAVAGDAAEIAAASGISAEFHASPESAASALAGMLRQGDAVLFKASRGVQLERARDIVCGCLGAVDSEGREAA